MVSSAQASIWILAQNHWSEMRTEPWGISCEGSDASHWMRASPQLLQCADEDEDQRESDSCWWCCAHRWPGECTRELPPPHSCPLEQPQRTSWKRLTTRTEQKRQLTIVNGHFLHVSCLVFGEAKETQDREGEWTQLVHHLEEQGKLRQGFGFPISFWVVSLVSVEGIWCEQLLLLV